jgi:hypothetical protein
MIHKKCKECNKDFTARGNNRKFCSRHCAGKYNYNKFNKLNTRDSREKQRTVMKQKFAKDKVFRQKTIDKLKKWRQENPDKILRGEKLSKLVGNATKGKYNLFPKNIYDMSGRTRQKVIQRLRLSCFRCEWNEGTCDLHHIHGKKIEDCDNHCNLVVLCPNCHRLVHNNKIILDKIKTFEELVGTKWLEFYYG